jgi:hypothetical protein
VFHRLGHRAVEFPDLCRPVDERNIEKGLVTMQAATQQAPPSSVVVPGAAQAGRP